MAQRQCPVPKIMHIKHKTPECIFLWIKAYAKCISIGKLSSLYTNSFSTLLEQALRWDLPAATVVFLYNVIPQHPSMNFKGVTLTEAKASLVVVKERSEGADVHGMVHVYHILARVVDFWNCYRFTNCGRKIGLKKLYQNI